MSKVLRAQAEHQSEKIHVIYCYPKEGNYAFSEYKISKDILEKHGELLFKSEYDLFAIIKNQITHKIMDILGL